MFYKYIIYARNSLQTKVNKMPNKHEGHDSSTVKIHLKTENIPDKAIQRLWADILNRTHNKLKFKIKIFVFYCPSN
jgi:hypothetical protein